MHFSIGRLAIYQKDYERGREALQAALDIGRELYNENSTRLLPTLQAMAVLEIEATRSDGQKQCARGDATQMKRAEEIASSIAAVHRRLAESTDPEKQRQARAVERIHEHNLIACLHQKRGQMGEALGEVEKTIGIFKLHGVDRCDTRSETGNDYVWSLHDAGELALYLKDWPQAQARLRQARDMYSRCSPGDDELQASIEKNLALVRERRTPSQ